MNAKKDHFALSAPATLALGLALLFVYLSFRNTGLYPSIFADETAYSMFARVTPLAEATVPSFLYFALFSATSSCGDSFLDCARLFNAVLFLGAAPFIYLIACRLMRPSLACVSALLSVAGPANLYTLYFMPEASYFFCFWALTWAMLRFHEHPTAGRALASGLLLGLLTLVKMHGLFTIPALCLFLAWGAHARRTAGRHWLGEALRSLLLVLGAAALVRFGLGYLFAGSNGLSLFGSLYRAQAGNSPAAGQPLPQVAAVALRVLRGHLMGLAVLCGVPLAALLAFGLVRSLREAAAPPVRALALYTVAMLGSLVAVTVMFTVSVNGTGFDTDQRLHMRYYDFALPLLTIFVAAQVDAAGTLARRIALPLALLAGAAVLYTAWRMPADYTPLIADSPALHSLTMFPLVFPLFCLLVLATLVAWARNPGRGAALFLHMLMPIFAIGGATALSREIRWAVYADAYVNGARFARDYLDPVALGRLTVVGASVPGLYKARFFLSSAGAKMHEVPNTEGFDLAGYPDKKNWLLVVGKFKAPAAYTARIVEGRGYALVKPRKPSAPGVRVIDFSQVLADEGVARNKGLSGPEAFGRWTDAKEVELEMESPLPKKLSLELKLYAFGPNSGQDVLVAIGGQERHFAAPEKLATVKLDFDTAGGERRIRITVPKPASPRQLGTGEDLRPLGLALHELRLRDKAQAGAAGN